MFTYPMGLFSEVDDTPIGAIVAWLGGYFTDSNNGGYTKVLAGTQSISEINTHFASKGLNYRVCDGSAPNDPASPIWNGPGKHLPNLTDERFLMGSSTVGTVGGSNNIIPQGRITGATTINHQHFIDHTHSIDSHSHLIPSHRHLVNHSHTVSPSIDITQPVLYMHQHGHINKIYPEYKSHRHQGGTGYHTHVMGFTYPSGPTYGYMNAYPGSSNPMASILSGYTSDTFITQWPTFLDSTHNHSMPSDSYYGATSGNNASHSSVEASPLNRVVDQVVSQPTITLDNQSYTSNSSLTSLTTSGSTSSATEISGIGVINIEDTLPHIFEFVGAAIESRPKYLNAIFLVRIS